MTAVAKGSASGGRRLLGELRAQLAIDRTGLGRFRRSGWPWKVAALCVVAGMFWWGWGEGTVTAWQIFTGGYLPSTQWTEAAIPGLILLSLHKLAVTAVAISIIVAVRRVVPRSGVQRATWRAFSRTFFVATAIVFLGIGALAVISRVVGGASYPHPEIPGGWTVFWYAVNGALAGPSEELALMCLVVVLLRRTGFSWTWVAVVAVVVRVPFHMYYGWGALGLAVWAALIVLLYRRTGLVWPIVLEHSVWNLLAVPEWSALGAIVKIAIVLIGVLIVLSLLLKRIGGRSLREVFRPSSRAA